MGKALIIAEKPSVASDIAKAIGGFKKVDDYYESDNYVLSSAVGHLLELIAPEGVEATRGKWTFKALPVIPPHFDLRPIEKSESRLKVLSKLIKRKDVDALVNACDAGREGELIFRNIIKYTKAKQPIQRLWLQSMTPAAIREGFAKLRDDGSMLPLADSASPVGVAPARSLAICGRNSTVPVIFSLARSMIETVSLCALATYSVDCDAFICRATGCDPVASVARQVMWPGSLVSSTYTAASRWLATYARVPSRLTATASGKTDSP